MIKKIIFIFLISFVLSCSSQSKIDSEDHGPFYSNMDNIISQGLNPTELNNIISQSNNRMGLFTYNACLTGELSNIRIIIDLYNSKISDNEKYLLFPVRLTNQSNQEVSFDSLNDKLYLILHTKNGDESYQLQLLNCPRVLSPNKESIFIAMFHFKDSEQRIGFESTLMFLKIFIDGLNTASVPPDKKELTKFEKEMQKVWKAKFTRVAYDVTIPLVYKIIKQ